MTLRRLSVAIACVGVLALPTAAWAAHKLVPPGNSGASQYFEAVPSAGGNTPPPQPTSALPASPGDTALAKLGKHGQAAAALAAAGAPTPAGSAGSTHAAGTHHGGPTSTAGRHRSGANPTTGRHVAVPSGNGAIDSIAGAVTGSGSNGVGVVLPILLAGALAAAVTFAVVRRMRRDPA